VTSVDVEGIDVDEVWLDLPVVGRGENRFAQWAYNPVPRMNPPHDVGRWRDDVGQSDLYLLNSLMAIGRGEAPSEMWLRALDRGVPDVIANGLSRVIIHRQEGNPAAEVAWDQMLLRAGGERTVVNERVMVYQF
jgi:hypothetical protein